ncbi:MAG: hypothetical protein ACYTGX_03610 [Planctomycetota bacterium]|jgi:hypothetical protein
MRRTALIWLVVLAVVLGGVALPAQADGVCGDALAGMGGGETLRALPLSVRPHAAISQWQPVGAGAASDNAVTVDVPAWHDLRELPDAPPARPVPIIPSDPEAPGTGRPVPIIPSDPEAPGTGAALG